MKPFTLRATAGSAVAVLFMALSSPISAQQCPIGFTIKRYPQMAPPSTFIGYQLGGYNKTGLFTPEPIPLGVAGSDVDTVEIQCDTWCSPIPFSTQTTADWTLTQGSFLDSDATEVPSITDANYVLFLPRDDVDPGETEVMVVRTTYRDVCSQGAPDETYLVRFRISVTRRMDLKYDVDAVFLDVSTVVGFSEPCVAIPSDCELLTSPDDDVLPTITITNYPSDGMVLGEMRMLQADAEDLDLIQGECGLPKAVPPVSNFGQQSTCDSLTYTWSMLSGTGVFVGQGRSTLFRPTSSGTVTIRLLVQDSSGGETASTTIPIAVREPRVDRYAWKNSHDIYTDATGALYSSLATFHWDDRNDNGQASDVGDYRFPAAYTRSDVGTDRFVEIQKIVLTNGDGNGNQAVDFVPRAVLRGSGPDGQEFEFAVEIDSSFSTELFAEDLISTGALPMSVKKYDPYEIEWDVSFGDDQFFDAGITEAPLYVTLNDPIVSDYNHPESAYDISCIAADGATEIDNGGVRDMVWNHVAGQVLNRKAVDGFNQTDGSLLKYWRIRTPAPPSTMAGMMNDPEGDGQCSAFSQLLRSCWQIHGAPAGEVVKVSPLDPNVECILVQTWKEIGSAPWYVEITLKDPGLGPFAGIPGQGVRNPWSRFIAHYIVLQGGNHWDPSYAVKHAASGMGHENAVLGYLAPDGSGHGAEILEGQDTQTAELQYTGNTGF